MPAQPTSLLTGQDLHKSYGDTALLDGVSVGLLVGDRVGVVGRNGQGKTTLIQTLAGQLAPDAGRVVQAGSVTVRLFDQQADVSGDANVAQVVVGQRAKHEWAGQHETRAIITGLLGADASDLPHGLDTVCATLSGGQRRRVVLAALLAAPLLTDHEVIILDEPTNHLDVEAVAWLAGHLNARRSLREGALVVVTHDRWFLDEVCTTTWEVHRGQVHPYEGSYAAYVLAKAQRLEQEAASEQRRRNLLRKELAWLRRGPAARTSKAKYRVDAANALIATEPPPREQQVLLNFAATRLGKTVLELEGATLRLGEKLLLDNVTWQLGPGERLGVVGVNGAGKTSLLRLLVGQLAADSGRVVRGKTVALGYLPQHVTALPSNRRVLQAVEDVGTVLELTGPGGKLRTVTASQLCEQLGFAGATQAVRVGDLSGGQRRRLQLVRLLMQSPNVLLLDEPTNDLDTDTLAAVEDLLDGWAGSLMVVSHDRYLLERVCERTLGLFGDGRLRDLPGGVEQYLALRAQGNGQAGGGEPAGSGGLRIDRDESAGGSAQADAPTDAKRQRELAKELARIERQLDKLAAQEQHLHAALAQAATDYTAAATLDADLRCLHTQREELENQWLELSEAAEG